MCIKRRVALFAAFMMILSIIGLGSADTIGSLAVLQGNKMIFADPERKIPVGGFEDETVVYWVNTEHYQGGDIASIQYVLNYILRTGYVDSANLLVLDSAQFLAYTQSITDEYMSLQGGVFLENHTRMMEAAALIPTEVPSEQVITYSEARQIDASQIESVIEESISKPSAIENEPNLLIGTNQGTTHFKVTQKGCDFELSEYEDGIWLKKKSHDDSGWFVLSFDDGSSRQLFSGNPGAEYTLSFDMMSNIEGANATIDHRNLNAKYNQITFGKAILTKANVWQHFKMTGTVLGVEASTQVLYFNMKDNPSGTEIMLKNLMLVEGNQEAEWAPAENDNNLLLGAENGIDGYKLINKGCDPTLEATEEGIKVTKAGHDDEGWLVLFFDDGHSREILSGPEGAKYSLCFDLKSNVAGANISVSHRNTNAKDNQIDFGKAVVEYGNAWQHFELIGVLNGVEATGQGLYFSLKNNPAGTEFYIKNLRLIHSESNE